MNEHTGKKRSIRRYVVAGLLFALIANVIGIYVGFSPFSEIRKRQALYETIERGMSREQVLEIMGPPDYVLDSGLSGPFWWDNERLDAMSPDHVHQAIRYVTATFYLPGPSNSCSG
jgi:hypothetical protein